MKTITLKVQVKIDEKNLSSLQDPEDLIEDILNDIETPREDGDGHPVNHLKKYGYEVMIMDRSDK